MSLDQAISSPEEDYSLAGVLGPRGTCYKCKSKITDDNMLRKPFAFLSWEIGHVCNSCYEAEEARKKAEEPVPSSDPVWYDDGCDVYCDGSCGSGQCDDPYVGPYPNYAEYIIETRDGAMFLCGPCLEMVQI